MTDYISRESALQAIIKLPETRGYGSAHTFEYVWEADAICDVVKEIPAADVAPVVHGMWIKYPRPHYFKCSICRMIVPYEKAVLVNGQRRYHYCPNCGAKMDLEG